MTAMVKCATYHLTFRSPLHIGERGVGLEETRTYVPADTLFSALCMSWREMYGADALDRDVLDWFSDSEPGNEPFFLSSAFPFAGIVRFFPKPLAQLGNVKVGEDDQKAFKRVRFVSERVFTAIVRGEEVTFRKGDCANGGSAWMTEEEKTELSPWTDDQTGEIVLWKKDVTPHVTLDRITSASEIWHFGEARFAEGAGLWFAAEFNADHGDELRRRFEACLRLLGDMGLGGKRSAGRGLFEMSAQGEMTLPGSGKADRFVTLAPLCPRDETEVEALTDAGAVYELIPRRGWVTSPEAGSLRRKMVWTFAEGSVLTGSGSAERAQALRARAGRLVDVTPEEGGKPGLCPHPVWRYGYAFPVGVKAT